MIKLSQIPTLVANFILFLLEYLFKISAGIVTVIVLGIQGSFFSKLWAGFGSLIEVYHRIIAWPDKLSYMGTIIKDYNTLTASAFNQRYGGEAINSVMEYLNEGVVYFQIVYQNLAMEPISTILATLIAFLFFYISARVIRFVRQRGRGSFLVRKEREIGRRVFKNSEI